MTTNLPTVRFLHVIGHRAHRPGVLAIVDGTYRVRWKRREWTCDCDAPDGATCEHVDIVLALLHPNVLGTDQ